MTSSPVSLIEERCIVEGFIGRSISHKWSHIEVQNSFIFDDGKWHTSKFFCKNLRSIPLADGTPSRSRSRGLFRFLNSNNLTKRKREVGELASISDLCRSANWFLPIIILLAS